MYSNLTNHHQQRLSPSAQLRGSAVKEKVDPVKLKKPLKFLIQLFFTPIRHKSFELYLSRANLNPVHDINSQ